MKQYRTKIVIGGLPIGTKLDASLMPMPNYELIRNGETILRVWYPEYFPELFEEVPEPDIFEKIIGEMKDKRVENSQGLPLLIFDEVVDTLRKYQKEVFTREDMICFGYIAQNYINEDKILDVLLDEFLSEKEQVK